MNLNCIKHHLFLPCGTLRLKVLLEISETELETALRFMARTTTLRLFGSAIDLMVLLLDRVKV